jgi:hypothetical protein
MLAVGATGRTGLILRNFRVGGATAPVVPA